MSHFAYIDKTPVLGQRRVRGVGLSRIQARENARDNGADTLACDAVRITPAVFHRVRCGYWVWVAEGTPVHKIKWLKSSLL